MKPRSAHFVAGALLLSPIAVAVHAQQPAPEPPPPVVQAPPAPQPAPAVVPENQQLYVPANPTLIPAAHAQALVAKFSEAYAKMGSPRVLFYVNRELVDTASGVKLNSRTERFENRRSTGANAGESTATSGDNTYALKEPAKPTLADRQTVREVERLFGRAFRAAGAGLADQKVAADLIADRPLGDLVGTTDQASKDREALGKVADVVVEILISSRSLTVQEVSGDQTLSVPDIQATAIRLKDAAILAQAAASDVLGKGKQAGDAARSFDVRDITEATALALMEDWLTGAK